ncbi:MAG: hypothetical protein IKN67_03180 [Alphaproteobacteria bacterium]|nr:hypothetical protein [Alphaproteobacteria bacterium]
MEKFIAFGKLYLSEILFAVVSALTLALAVYGVICKTEMDSALFIAGALFTQIICLVPVQNIFSLHTKKSLWLAYFAFAAILIGIVSLKVNNQVGLCGVLLNMFFWGLCKFTWNIKISEKPQGPFLIPVNKNKTSRTDIVPEPAEKLPYVYYDKPVEQTAYTIHYYSPYLGKQRSIPFQPREERGKPFDDVRGIVVADNLILLRSILFTDNFPDDIREMAKQYDGRLPNKAEIKQIYSNFCRINQNLYECCEPLLRRWKYLYTSGDENADKAMNYCLNFATGQESLADCDSFVCAVLVEKSIPDVKHLEADIKAFKKKHLNKTKLGDEFDLLCEVNGQKVRLPFSKRHLGKPIGIFPFAGPEYLELEEQENKKHTDKDVDESRLLDERFCCGCVSTVVDRLNLYLKEMNKPLLEGSYLADSSYMRGSGWIIGFDSTSDYYGVNVPAKLRYMGRFYGKCQK